MTAMRASRTRPPPVELTDDPRIVRRVRRLAPISAVALGCIWALATATVRLPPLVSAGLAAGWLLMPLLLWLSLRWPLLRRGLLVPASLVSGSLLAICASALPPDGLARSGWLLLTAGVLFGGVLGAWFWFRWLPVPDPLHDPLSKGRRALIALHVASTLAGFGLVLVSVISGATAR